MSKKKPSYSKAFKNHSVLIFDDNNSITHFDVFNIDNGCIETESDILELKDCQKFYDNNNGGFTYVFNVPEVAKVEAESLKKLRRNKVIKNIMTYETEKSMDLGKMFPYFIALAALLF
jgi:hypothetical protein